MSDARSDSPADPHAVPLGPIQAWLERDLLPRCRPGQSLGAPPRSVRGRDTGDGERVDWLRLELEPSGETLEVVLTFASAETLAGAADDRAPDVAYSPALGCLAEVFPRDRELPDLARAMRPDWALERQDGPHWISGARGARLDARLLRYRPHSRAVLHYLERDALGHVTAEAIGKVFRSPGKAERAWRLLVWIDAHVTGGPIVPRPYTLRDSVVVMEKVPGVDLDAVLEQPGDVLAREAVRAAARALRAFHAVPPGDLKSTKPSKHMRSIVELAQALAHHSEIERLVVALEARDREPSGSSEAVLAHGSFKPTAVLFGDQRATIVDLDYAGLGDRLDDIAHFTGHVRRLAVQRADGRLDALADEFIAAYGPLPGEDAARRRIRFLEATLFALSGLKALAAAGTDGKDGSEAGIEQGLMLLNAAERRLG
jgi:aminoglycoside phosphotransferase